MRLLNTIFLIFLAVGSWPRLTRYHHAPREAYAQNSEYHQWNLPSVVIAIDSAQGHPSSGPITTTEDKDSDSPPESSWKKPEWMIVWVTSVYTLVSTLALMLLGIQIKLARQSSEQQLRAYVMCEMVSIVNVAPAPAGVAPKDHSAAVRVHPNNGPYAQMRIKNAGQTPAYRLEHWGDMCYREYPLTGKLAEVGRTARPMPSVLGPGNIATKGYRSLPPLNDAQIKSLQDGTGAIYVHGEITYIDAFGKSRYTRYCLIHNRLTGVVGITTDLTFNDIGNEAT